MKKKKSMRYKIRFEIMEGKIMEDKIKKELDGPIKMFFGKKLREMRLKKNIGLRNFSRKIDVCVSKYSLIEQGFIPPPSDKKLLYKIYLGLEEQSSSDWAELFILYKAPFIMQEMNENGIPSPFTHKADGTQLTGEEFKKLHDHINNEAKKHNKKAREYNKKIKNNE